MAKYEKNYRGLMELMGFQVLAQKYIDIMFCRTEQGNILVIFFAPITPGRYEMLLRRSSELRHNLKLVIALCIRSKVKLATEKEMFSCI